MSVQHSDEVPPEQVDAPTGPAGTAQPILRSVTPRVPTQSPGEHDDLPDARPRDLPATRPAVLPLVAPVEAPAEAAAGSTGSLRAPEGQWTAPQPGRWICAGLLLVALSGTGVLGWRYYGSGTSGDLTALVVGLAVVVVLWGMTVIATPQVVNVRGSVLTVFAGRDEERYDLADLHQEVDLTGEPGSPSWALVLHRRDGSARVIRAADADSVVLDALVRLHRDRATERAADRERRFTR